VRLTGERPVREQVAAQAATAFAGHDVLREGPTIWRCSAPGTVIYNFRVLLVPGTIVVTGDIGHMILRVEDHDPSTWALCAFKEEIDYGLSKVPAFIGRDP
jgi:hypothetical protein